MTHCDKETPGTGLKSELRPIWGASVAGQKSLSLPGHSLVPALSPPPRGTVTYLAGTVCSQGTGDTGGFRTRCPVPAVSGPRSGARRRGQGVWAGPVHPASPGSAKGPTHRAHHYQGQWPRDARSLHCRAAGNLAE